MKNWTELLLFWKDLALSRKKQLELTELALEQLVDRVDRYLVCDDGCKICKKELVYARNFAAETLVKVEWGRK